jgi:HTH-type transcriptional regulator/antitoxin MqsA
MEPIAISEKKLCPVCAKGVLFSRVGTNEVEYNGHKGVIDCHYSVCSACGSEIAGAKETRRNKEIMIEFRSQHG